MPDACIECGGALQWRCPACRIAQTAEVAAHAATCPLYEVVAQILDAGHMNTEDLGRLRAAWEAA